MRRKRKIVKSVLEASQRKPCSRRDKDQVGGKGTEKDEKGREGRLGISKGGEGGQKSQEEGSGKGGEKRNASST